MWRIFHSFGDVNITGEVLQIVPILGTHGIWAVRVLLWHGQSFIRVISEDFVRVSTKTVPIYKWSMCIFTKDLVETKTIQRDVLPGHVLKYCLFLGPSIGFYLWHIWSFILLIWFYFKKYKIFKYESIIYFVRLTKGFYLRHARITFSF